MNADKLKAQEQRDNDRAEMARAVLDLIVARNHASLALAMLAAANREALLAERRPELVGSGGIIELLHRAVADLTKAGHIAQAVAGRLIDPGSPARPSVHERQYSAEQLVELVRPTVLKRSEGSIVDHAEGTDHEGPALARSDHRLMDRPLADALLLVLKMAQQTSAAWRMWPDPISRQREIDACKLVEDFIHDQFDDDHPAEAPGPAMAEGMEGYLCDNCANIYANLEDLDQVRDLVDRIQKHGQMPDGQCPSCGGLAYSL